MVREEMVRGLPAVQHVDQLFEGLLGAKKRRTPFLEVELVHGDLCGPILPPASSGNKYFILLVDDRSRFVWVSMLRSKDQVVEAIKQFKVAAEGEAGRKFGVLHTNRGGEFTSVSFTEYTVEACVGSWWRRTHHNKMEWSSTGIARWWQLPAAC